jgi:predicted nucleic acid-binding protein
VPTARGSDLRLVLDTNTALSGLIWRGVPGELIDSAISGRVQLISSLPLLSELEGVLRRPTFQQSLHKHGVSGSDLFDGYAALVECVAPADLIVSGDDDLLVLDGHLGIPIVSARDALNCLRRQDDSSGNR